MENEKVYELFNILKKRLDKAPDVDMTEIKSLTQELIEFQTETQNYVNQLGEVISESRKPVIHQKRFTLNIESQSTVFIFIGMVVIITGLSSWLYLATRPNYDRIDNDLKYRYIKMKGEATPERISDLENIFEINRDNSKIRQLRTDVETYERVVQQKVALDEQNRLRQLEAERLNKEAEKIKGK